MRGRIAKGNGRFLSNSVLGIVAIIFAVSEVRAEGYVPQCITESVKEAMKDMNIKEDEAKKVATAWCNCFRDGAVKAGQKDTYDDLDKYYTTPEGKKLDNECGNKSGWK